MPDNSYPKSARIRKRGDFVRLQSSAKKLYTKHFLIVVSQTLKGRPRLGITVTRKVDSRAVARNKLRRRIREIFRLYQRKLLEPFDMIVIARNGSIERSYAEVRKEILGVLKHNNLLGK